jgi:dienelactone hydrolase
MRKTPLFLATALLTGLSLMKAPAQTLPGTAPLKEQGDFALQMVYGIDRYLGSEWALAFAGRASHWKRDLSSRAAYEASVQPNAASLRKMIGATDARSKPDLRVERPASGAALAQGKGYRVDAVRWSALPGVEGEGLLLVPVGTPKADIIALPDCDNTPEELAGLAPGISPDAQFARRLAEAGCRVLIPVLIDRRDTWSGIPGVRMTNEPHREWIYRAAYELGRTPIGLEAQKVLAAVDWFRQDALGRPVGVFGYGEGGLVALYTAAIDPRIDAAGVSGYFGRREQLWKEPIYRNVFGLLREFGDAEIASLVAPRPLVVEASPSPEITGPPKATGERSGTAAPGTISTPPYSEVVQEFERAEALVAGLTPPAQMTRVHSDLPGSSKALNAFLRGLGIKNEVRAGGPAPKPLHDLPDPEARQKRQFQQLCDYTQTLMADAPEVRTKFWKGADASSVAKWQETTKPYREIFWDDVIGRLPPASLPANARTRLIYETPKLRGYEVMLDVYPHVFAYGILLVPKNIKPGERRPVVVCQHGLEGRAQDVADPAVDNHYYHRFAVRLAEEGFITYAPQNPYIGGDRFRLLLRRAQPLHLTLFSFITRQHERTLDWLSTLPFVDPARMAFYGLSYGGKTAMRVPAVLDRYCLSICSADYNEWIWKNASMRSPYSYLLLNEYDMPEWNVGNTFNYAEMSGLICPRPFMVERGHDDGVAPDEWVAYEYARTRRRYDLLGIGDRTELEVFNGPHTIHGVGTFAFLRKHLHWGENP